jgi:hypothetical protein
MGRDIVSLGVLVLWRRNSILDHLFRSTEYLPNLHCPQGYGVVSDELQTHFPRKLNIASVTRAHPKVQIESYVPRTTTPYRSLRSSMRRYTYPALAALVPHNVEGLSLSTSLSAYPLMHAILSPGVSSEGLGSLRHLSTSTNSL